MKLIPNQTKPEPAVEPAGAMDFDLGTWLGRRQAFGSMAGKALAADVECLRQIREQKLYRAKTANWGDFCTRFVGASKTSVNRLIHELEEYGPDAFYVLHATHVPREAFPAIAQHVTGEGLRFEGRLIPITQENSQEIASAVASMVRKGDATAPAARRSFPDIEKRLAQCIAHIGELPPLEPAEKLALATLVMDLRQRAAGKGALIIPGA